MELRFGDKKLGVLPSSLGLPKKACLSSDLGWLVFRDVTEPSLMRLWDCRLQRLQGRFSSSGDLAMLGNIKGTLSGIAFSPDNLLIASTYARGGEDVLEVNEVNSQRTIMAREGFLAIYWSRDGKFLLSCSRRSPADSRSFSESGIGNLDSVKPRAAAAQIWAVSCPVPVYQVREPVEWLKFRADGRLLAVNDTAWDVTLGNDRIALRQIALPNAGFQVGFHEDAVWGVSSFREINSERDQNRQFDEYRQWDKSMAAAIFLSHFSLDGGLGSIAKISGFFADIGPVSWERPKVVQLLPENQEAILMPSTNQHWRFRFTPRNELGFSYVTQPYRIAWSADGSKLLAILRTGCHSWRFLDMNKPGRWVPGSVISHIDSLVEAWDIPSGRRHLLTFPSRNWKDIAWQPAGRSFATASEQAIQIWDLASGVELVKISNGDFDRVLWSKDGRYLLTMNAGKKAAVYKVEGNEVRVWSTSPKDWSAFTLSGEGRYVISGGEDGLLHVLSVESGKEVARWKAHDSAVTAMTFSPDGKLLVSGARDGTLRVWNLPWIRSELAKLGLDWSDK